MIADVPLRALRSFLGLLAAADRLQPRLPAAALVSLMKCCAGVNTSHRSHVSCGQVQVGGKKTSIVLQKLEPDTPYSVSVAAVYPTAVSQDISEEGRTSKIHIQIKYLLLLIEEVLLLRP